LDPSLPLGGAMERGAADAAPPPHVPLVLQVSPLPGSTDREEYFYEASPNDCNGPFATACAFFSVRGHVVAVHDCLDIAAFQAARPFGMALRPLANLPSRDFVEGSKALQALALVATPVPTVPAAGAPQEGGGLFPSSLMNCYADIPSVSRLARSLPGGGPPGPTSLAGASYGSSHPPHWPDPKGFDVAVSSLPSSLWVGLSHYGGYSSHPYGYGRGYEHPYDLVSPLCHGGASISLAAP
jgi:hypothetical protein